MKHNKIYFIHIIEELEFIEKQSKNLNFNEFVENEIYTRAFSRSIEIIGEAVKNISDDLRKSTVK